ncbi:YciI family protein [Neobacillus sp. NPDC058068]|uniref:YciI family protein n=1 Tax=Neobacillus sp. NPDC058068 TaxID=3346325 RepID=UPI0036D8CCB3
MAYFAAILHMIDTEKNKEVLPRHIQYLDELDVQGKIFARGPFLDESGGLVVYVADSFEEAHALAVKDPHVVEGSRKLELKQWKILVKS